MTLAEFVEACVAEDKAAARAAQFSNGRWHRAGEFGRTTLVAPEFGPVVVPEQVGSIAWDNNGHIARWDPARVLAECEAKRRIVEAYREERARCDAYQADEARAVEDDEQAARRRSAAACCRGLEIAVQLLALPYAGRPGYQPEWAL